MLFSKWSISYSNYIPRDRDLRFDAENFIFLHGILQYTCMYDLCTSAFSNETLVQESDESFIFLRLGARFLL